MNYGTKRAIWNFVVGVNADRRAEAVRLERITAERELDALVQARMEQHRREMAAAERERAAAAARADHERKESSYRIMWDIYEDTAGRPDDVPMPDFIVEQICLYGVISQDMLDAWVRFGLLTEEDLRLARSRASDRD